MAWTATFAVGVVIIAIALAMARGRHSVFGTMVTFNTVMSLAYGPPALLGLVVRRTPSWSGLASFAVALAVGAIGASSSAGASSRTCSPSCLPRWPSSS